MSKYRYQSTCLNSPAGRCLLWFILVLCPMEPVFAQEHHFRQYDVMDGLPGSFVLRVIEDDNGKLLICTSKGVCTYDGSTFKTLGEKDGLTENFLFHVAKDTIENCFWFLGFGDKVFRYKNGVFTRVLKDQAFCWLEIEPGTGTKLLLNRRGHVFRFAGGKASFIAALKAPPADSIDLRNNKLAFAMLPVGKDAFIIGTVSGFYYLSKHRQVTLPVPMSGTSSGVYPRIFRRANGTILLASDHGVYQYEAKSFRCKRIFSLHQKEVISLYDDTISGDIWLGTSKGVYHFANGVIADNTGICYLQSSMVNCIYRNSEGMHWFGTRIGGLFSTSRYAVHYKLGGQGFTFLGHDYKNIVYAFSHNGDISFIENGSMEQIPKNRYSIGLSGNIRLVIQHSSSGLIILSGSNAMFLQDKKLEPTRGLSVLESETEKNCCYYFMKDGLIQEQDTVRKIIVSRKQSSWMEKHFRFLWGLGGPSYIDKQGRLYHEDRQTRDIHKITLNGMDIRDTIIPIGSKLSNMVGLFNDSLILIGTEGKGVAVYDRNGNVSWINKDRGLLSDFCTKIYADNEYLWVCTNAGLSRLLFSARGEVKEIANFTFDNVLLSNDVNDVMVLNDTAYVATSRGISLFLRNTRISQVDYRCFIEKLEINNRDTTVISGHQFPYDRNNVTITLGQSSLQLDHNGTYRYVLSPAEDTVVIRSNILNLASVQPGTYQLSVWARNLDGVWSAQPAYLDFTIAPPFWKTLWFKLILGGIVAIIVLVVVYSYQRRQRKKAEVEKRLIESDLRSLRLHMNPHFIFNSLTSLQSFIVTQKTAEAEKYISQFSNMIRSVMGYSVVGEITLAEEVEFLKQYIELELIRFDDQFEYSVSVDDGIQPDNIIIPSLLIQPLVENAIKHGLTGLYRKSNLSVYFSMNNGRLYCSVEDDGRGRSDTTVKFNKVSGHTSTGIKFTEERIRLLIKDESVKPVVITDLMIDGKPAGTRVTMVIPVLE